VGVVQGAGRLVRQERAVLAVSALSAQGEAWRAAHLQGFAERYRSVSQPPALDAGARIWRARGGKVPKAEVGRAAAGS
jgi:hypothetical protein